MGLVMKIQSIKSELQKYEVGVANVTRITLTDHGSEKTIIYRIDYETKDATYVGMIVPHEVEYK